MSILLLLSAAFAADERMAVAVLPPLLAPGVPPELAGQVEQALIGAVPGVPGFRVLTLDAEDRRAFQADPGCRDQAGCLAEHLPEATELVVDARITQVNGSLALDLRLVKDGRLSKRQALAVPARGAGAAAGAEVPLLLSGWARDARLYALALEGNAEAEKELRRRFPESPYTRALGPE